VSSVEIQFADQKLKQCFVDKEYACRHLGSKVAARYAHVINFLGCIDTASDLPRFAFLDTVAPANSSESWTVALDRPWRLVLQPSEDGKAIEIMEVVS